MQTTVQPILAYQLNPQPIYLGLIGFASSLPALLIMLPSGVYIERMDKRKVVIVMQVIMMLQAFVLAVLTLTGVVTIWDIIVLAFILGAANAIEITARQAMIYELVSRQAMPNAIALNSTIFNLARVIGPTFSTPILNIIPEQRGGLGLFRQWYQLFIRNRWVVIDEFKIPSRPHQTQARAARRFYRRPKIYPQSLHGSPADRHGDHSVILRFSFFSANASFCRFSIKITWGHRCYRGYTQYVLIIAQGVGALIAALTISIFSNIKHKGMVLTVGQFVFAGALIGFSLARSIGLAMFFLVLVGWGTVTHLAMTNTLIQLAIPNDFRGRVMSTYFWAQSGVAPLGSLFIGWLAQVYGAPFAVTVGGSVCLIGYLAIHIVSPRVRQTATPESG